MLNMFTSDTWFAFIKWNHYMKLEGVNLNNVLFKVRTYRKVSNIRRTESKNLNDFRLVLKLSLPNPSKLDIMLRMKM